MAFGGFRSLANEQSGSNEGIKLHFKSFKQSFEYRDHPEFKRYINGLQKLNSADSQLSTLSVVDTVSLFRLMCTYADYPSAERLLTNLKASSVLEPGESEFYEGMLLQHRGMVQLASARLLTSVESMRPSSTSRMNVGMFAEAAYLTGRTAYMSEQYEIAAKYLKAAIRFFEPHQKEFPELYISTLNYLGNLSRSEGYFEEAREYLEESMEFANLEGRTSTAEFAELLNDLGLMYWFENELEAAMEFIEQGLQIRRKIFPNNHPSVTESLFNLAGLLESQKLYDEAEYYYRLCIKLTEESNSTMNQIIWVYKLSLLNFLMDMNRDNEAGSVITELEGALQRNAINNLNERLAVQVSLAEAMSLDQNQTITEMYFREAIKSEMELVRLGARDEMRARNKYLQYLYKNRKFVQAEKLFRDGIRFRRSFYGDNHMLVASSQISFADHLLKQTRCEEAIPSYQEALAIILAQGDKPGLNRAIIWQKLAQSHVNCNQLEDALKYARLIRGFFLNRNLSLSRHLDLLDMEGKVLLGLKNWSEALSIYAEGLGWLQSIPGDERPLLEGQFRSVLGELQLKQGQFMVAHEHLKAADQIFIAKGLELPMHYVRWCEYHLASGNYKQAENYLDQARAIVERKMQSEFDSDLIPILQLKTTLMIKQKNWDQAKALIRESERLISMNPGFSFRHIEINRLQQSLRDQIDQEGLRTQSIHPMN